jgi:hypothetical protein
MLKSGPIRWEEIWDHVQLQSVAAWVNGRIKTFDREPACNIAWWRKRQSGWTQT